MSKEKMCEQCKNCICKSCVQVAWLQEMLKEIKEIAENMNTECFYNDFDCKYCDMKNGCTYQRKLKILQKISECGVEDA